MNDDARPVQEDPREPVRLGLQQAVVAIPSVVALPLLIGLDSSAALLCAGVGTLLFQLATGRRVCVALASSYSFAYLLVTAAKIHGSAHAAGAAALAGAVCALAAAGLRLVQPATLRRLLPTHVTATAVLVLALALAPVAIQNANGSTSPAVVDRVGAWGAWLVAAASLAVGVWARFAPPRWALGAAVRLSVLAALAAGTLVALPLGVVDAAAVLKAPWVALPRFSLPRLAPELIVGALCAGLVAAVEHVGDLLAMETVTHEDYVADRTLVRTMLATGAATVVSAAVGGPPLGFSSESIGVAAVTGRRQPLDIRWAAVAMIVLAFFPKAGAAFASLPRVVIGGISILMYGALTVLAIRRMVSARVQIAEPRVGLVVALMLMLGIGGAQFSLGPASVSGVALALVAGVLLNLALTRSGNGRGRAPGGRPAGQPAGQS